MSSGTTGLQRHTFHRTRMLGSKGGSLIFDVSLKYLDLRVRCTKVIKDGRSFGSMSVMKRTPASWHVFLTTGFSGATGPGYDQDHILLV